MRRSGNVTNVTAAQRRDAINLARAVGAAEASRRLGYKDATIRQWVKRATQTTDEALARAELLMPAPTAPSPPIVAEQTTDGAVTPAAPLTPAAGRASWQAKRGGILDNAATAAERIGRELATTSLHDGRRLRDLSVTLGVLIDKALLLAGEPTAMTATTSTSVSYVVDGSSAKVADQLQALRAELGIGPGGRLGAIETTGSDE